MTAGQDAQSNPSSSSSQAATVLIVDDELTGRMAARKLIVGNPHIDEAIECVEASTIPDALSLLAQLPIDVVLLDKNVGPDPSNVSQNGIESIPEMLRLKPALRVLVLTASSKSEDITRAMKMGAFDYLLKTSSKESRQKKVADAIDQARVAFRRLAIARLNDPFPKEGEVNLGGSSALWKKAVSRAIQFAPSQFPVLITGPTGCGKTELARMIHLERKRLKRDEKGFIAINIAAISADLAERELFGNEKGAYTGADERKPGYFELANRGTLFLDEIGDADLDLQKKLLKVIEEGKFYRLGGKEVLTSTFKLICATHRDLNQMVAQGRFREDLYMRISTLPLSVPPLSQRKEDTPEIIAAMVPRICKLVGTDISFNDLPDDFIRYLTENEFQGNARGIWQQVARLLVLAPESPSGKKVFSNWFRLLELDSQTVSPHTPIRTGLSLNDVLKTPLELFGADFPGVNQVVSIFHDRIYMEARRQYQTNNAVARTLKVSNSTASLNLRRIENVSSDEATQA